MMKTKLATWVLLPGLSLVLILTACSAQSNTKESLDLSETQSSLLYFYTEN